MLARLCLLLLLGPTLAMSASNATSPTRLREPPRGLWLLPRKDAANTGRADLPARMPVAPTEVWRHGGDAGVCSFASEIAGVGTLRQIGRGLELRAADGTTRWQQRTLGVTTVVEVADLTGDGRPEALVLLGQTALALLDVATGRNLWQWTAAPGTFALPHRLLMTGHGARLFLFPSFTLTGMCFDFAGTDGRPRTLWQREHTGKYSVGFGPNLVLADMDNDGRPEIVLASKLVPSATSGYLAVLDSDTGAVKFDLHYPIRDGADAGRPYGLLQAVDLDGDGFRDVLLASVGVEEYVSVVRNDSGKSLSLLWAQFIEKDFPTDIKQLVATTTSVADVNGDGKPELVFGLFNHGLNERWRTVVLDPRRGLAEPLAELPDVCFRGCYDLDGDGVAEIIVNPATTRTIAGVATLRAIEGRTYRPIATLEHARLVTTNATLTVSTSPLGNNIAFHGSQAAPIQRDGGLLVRLVPGKTRGNGATEERLWTIRDRQNRLEPAISSSADARASSASVAPSASCPLVSIAHGQRELVLALSDGTIVGGAPDLARGSGFRSSWKLNGTMPSIWLGPAGERIVCTVHPSEDTVVLQQPGWAGPPVSVRLPMPINRNGGVGDAYPRRSAWLVPFGARQLKLFVPMRLRDHSLACAVYDGRGKLLWSDAERGPHPRAAAVADLDGDGRQEIVVDNHGMQYIYDATGKAQLVAHCWDVTIPGRSDGCAHALPIVGPFGPAGAMRICMSPGFSNLETMDGAGARVAQRKLGTVYEFYPRVAAVAKPRGNHQWDMGVVSETGVFHCIDIEACRTRWTLDLGAPSSWSITVVAGDLTGNQRDDFLVGLPSGELVAVAEEDGAGTVLWRKQFDAAIIEHILADVDNDGLAELVVHTDDGYVRILKGGTSAAPAR